MTLKKICVIILAFVSTLCVAALPAVNSYIPDASGEYVYYQDTTFARPTYVGFLHYNSSEYALRYYAAADSKTAQDEVEVEVLISINPENEKLEFTGELVVKDGESTLINYMHDLFYDLTAKRKKSGDVAGLTDVTTNEFIDYFGGAVVMKFNSLVPIFNVKSIQNDAGEEQLKLVTVGALQDSQDTSFDDFKGFPSKMADKKRKAPKASKKTVTAQYAGVESGSMMSVKIDESWKNSVLNIWLQGNAAVLNFACLTLPEGDEKLLEAYVMRSLLRSSDHSYIDYRTANIKPLSDGFEISANYYLSKDSSVQHDTQRLVKAANGYNYMRLTVFDSLYQKKKSYYDSIVTSFSVK